MIYTIEKADMIAEQLKRFTSGYAHHVVGQFANLDFWWNEVQEALKAIDQYNTRFNRISDAQKTWVENHGTVVYDYCPYCGGKCAFADGKPSAPRRTPSAELTEARRQLIDAAYYFIARCYRLGLLNEAELKQHCDAIGTSIDPADLKK